MSLATGIGDLKEVVERYVQGGGGGGTDLVAGVRSLQVAAAEASLAELSELCRGAVQTLEQIAVHDTLHPESVLAYVLQLLDYAVALDSGEVDVSAVPPSAWTLTDVDDEQHFLETLEMFVPHALGLVYELEQDVSALDPSGHDAAVAADIRRAIHSLEAGFGVLKFAAAQRFCRVIETAIDAVVAIDAAFPAELVLDCVRVLVRYLHRLTEDPSASLEDVSGLVEWLRQAPFGRVDSEPLRLTCGGEFAGRVEDFLAESRAHLVAAEASMLTFPEGEGREHLGAAMRAFRAVHGVAGLLDLKPLAELVELTEVVLMTDRSGRHVELVLAAIDFARSMLDGLEGQPMPTRQAFTQLVQRLEAAVPSGEPPVEPRGEPPCEPGIELRGEPRQRAGDVGSEVSTESGPKAVIELATAMSPSPTFASSSVGDLVDVVRELTMAQSAVFEDLTLRAPGGGVLSRNIAQVAAITRRLQDAALALCKAAGGAVLEGLVVRAGRQYYVLPVGNVRRVFRATSDDLVDGGESVEVDGAVLAVQRLEQVFLAASASADLTTGLLVAVEVDGVMSCLSVDEVLVQQQVLDKGIGVMTGHVPGVGGATVLDDGQIALVLDVATIVTTAARPAS